ncbi:unnamed protein product [Owenia fusiformis]|uniref:Uncharacterized protein n=1 Tax=Owenia fusiformis TaxID=6347 RepID=A0A8J1U1L2_OWEFU|nr:unnamed protein product [Owenia fusiformis]
MAYKVDFLYPLIFLIILQQSHGLDIIEDLLKLNKGKIKDLCFDIVFALDRSCSVAEEDLDRSISFMTQMIKEIDIGAHKVQVGLVVFDDGARILIDVGQYNEKSRLLEAIDTANYTYNGCKTATWTALNLVRTSKKLLNNNEIDQQTKKPRQKILVVITDGVPFDTKHNMGKMLKITEKEAVKNHEAGITTIVVCIRNSDGEYVEDSDATIFDKLASKPLEGHKFYIDNLEVDAKKVFPTLARFTCDYRCSKPIDIVFILDCSMNADGYTHKALDFIVSLLKSFPINPERFARVGVVTFNDHATVEFGLTKHTTFEDIKNAIENIRGVHKKNRDTAYAFKTARQSVFYANEARNRVASRVNVLATSERAWPKGYRQHNMRKVLGQARYNELYEINTIIIGLPPYEPNIDTQQQILDEWQKLVTNKDTNNIFDMKSSRATFEDLEVVKNYIAKQMCDLVGLE